MSVAKKRPVIGIVVSPPEDDSGQYVLNPTYTDAVFKAGGTPIAVTLKPDADYVDDVLAMIDGLLLTGAMYDIDPARYGETPHEKMGKVFTDRDDTDALFIKKATKLKMPMLGICHGCQAINVARGGTIVQDIISEYGTEVNHRTPSNRDDYGHEVIFEPRSLFNDTDEKFNAKTNSVHHQSINRVGAGLKVIACTADGVIEAVESVDMDDHFVLAVQWHPERLAHTDDLSFRAFQGLVRAASN